MLKLTPKSPMSLRTTEIERDGVVLLTIGVCLHDCVSDLGFDRLSKMHGKTRKIHSRRMMGWWVNVWKT